MGYKVDSTMGGLATLAERAKRLGQAMDGNTIRWFGAFLYAAHNIPAEVETPSTGISVGGDSTTADPGHHLSNHHPTVQSETSERRSNIKHVQ